MSEEKPLAFFRMQCPKCHSNSTTMEFSSDIKEHPCVECNDCGYSILLEIKMNKIEIVEII